MATLALATLISLVLAVVALTKARNLEQKVADLQSVLKSVLEKQARLPQAERPPVVAVPPAPVERRATRPAARPPIVPDAPVAAMASAPASDATLKDILEGADPPPRSLSPVDRWVASMRESGEWEAMIGGHWLNRIGALALILGIGFFLKYAIDQNWISQSLRVGIGLLIGSGLVAGAYYSHRKTYTIFSQGLVGAGTSALYLSVYASYNFYHLIPASVALIAISAVTVLAFAQAMYYDSMAVAILAWFGAYLTPLLLTLQQPDEIGLFAYLLLLNAGLLAVLLRRDQWFVLEPPSIVATYAIIVLWYERSYSDRHVLLTTLLLTAVWALFFAYDSYSVFRSSRRSEELGHSLGLINGLVYFGLILALLEAHHRPWATAITFALGVMYAATIVALHRLHDVPVRMAARYTITSIVLLAIATILAGSGFWTAIALAVEALVLLGCGFRWRLVYVWQPALALYGVAAALLLIEPNAVRWDPAESFPVLPNERLLAYLVLAGALAAGSIYVRRFALKEAATVGVWLSYAWCATAFTGLTVETNDLFRREIARNALTDVRPLEYARWIALAAVWLLASSPVFWTGLRRRFTPFVVSGLAGMCAGVLTAGAVGAAFQPVSKFTPVLNLRAGLLVFVCLVLGFHMRWSMRRGEEDPRLKLLPLTFGATILLTVFELLSAEINDYFRHLGGGSVVRQGTDAGLFLELMLLACIWMAYSLPLVIVGLRRHSTGAPWFGSALAALAVVTAAYASIALGAEAQYGLVLSLRAVILPLLIAGLFLHLRLLRTRRDESPWIDSVLIAVQAAIVLLGFELVTGETRDLFRDLISTSTPGSSRIGHLRDLEQLTLSLVWLVYAIVLMGLGLWRRTRWVRLGALALLGVVVLKIFSYDLSFLAAAYRYISFAGLGVILIAVSFLYQRYRELLLEVS